MKSMIQETACPKRSCRRSILRASCRSMGSPEERVAAAHVYSTPPANRSIGVDRRRAFCYNPPVLLTTIAGSLPKPAWLAKPKTLWAPWAVTGEALVEAKRDAVLLALAEQEAAGIDVVTDGEQSRQHFVHGFLEAIE